MQNQIEGIVKATREKTVERREMKQEEVDKRIQDGEI